MALFVDVDDFGSPCLAKIKMILVNGNKIVCVCRKYVTVGFDEHVHAHKVVSSFAWECSTPEHVVVPQPFFVHTNIKNELRIIM